MTTIVRTTWTDGSTPNTGAAYGRIDIGAGNMLCRLRARGMISNPSSTFTAPSGNLTADSVWALAVMPFGVAPPSIPSNLNSGDFVASGGPETDGTDLLYAPTTATAWEASTHPFSIEWAGQLRLTAATSVYLQTGLLVVSGSGFAYFGNLTAWYA